MTLTGYPPEDLVLRRSFRRASADGAAPSWPPSWPPPGSATSRGGRLPRRRDGGPRNAAAFLQDGQVVARYFKHHLPNYGVFDEDRYFTAGTR